MRDLPCTYPAQTSGPDLVAAHPEHGIVALDIAALRQSGQEGVELNRKVVALREAIPALARTKVLRRVVDATAQRSSDKVLSLAAALELEWLAESPARPLDDETLRSVAESFSERLSIDVPIRTPMLDPSASARAARRIVLDEQQAAVARHDGKSVVALTGPPGSGKTLVLAARANWLATANPNWKIQILCFNRMLVPYLESLVKHRDNVTVSTFGKFAHSHGMRVSLDDEIKARRDVAHNLPIARARRPLDALLIDEWQDFLPCWTQLAVAMVRENRGGITLAGDPKQALYRDAKALTLDGQDLELVTLDRPYRSTRQILEVTSAMAENLEVSGREQALEGEPVDLVWAHNADEQAAAVARDALLLLESGERMPEDIGVLVTRKFQMGKIASHLGENKIPCRVVYANQAAELNFAEPTVKILTVHSAKGLEFDVIFLVGLEHLPNPDGTDERERQGRTGYVGATRARDQLVMTYSKDNVYLERIRRLPTEVLRRWVWPDDYPEV